MVNARSEGTAKAQLPMPPISHAQQQEDVGFLDLLLLITQRKNLVAIVTAACLAIALIAAFTLPQQYTATVIILPPQGNSLMSSMLAGQISGNDGGVSGMASRMLGMRNISDMYVSMLRSSSVEDAVIRRYNLQSQYRKTTLSDTRKALEDHTTIDGATKDGLIRLTFTDRDPNRSAELANGYVEQFKTLSQYIDVTEASQWRAIFETQLAKTKADLDNAEEALKSAQVSKGKIQIDTQAQAKMDSMARLRAQIVAKEVQIEALRSYPGDNFPALTHARTELEALRSRFNELTDSESVSQANPEYMRRLRNVKYNEAIVELLARQLEVARLDEARDRALIQVVDPAVTPEKPSFPKRGQLVAAGLTVGFTFGVMLALLQGGLARLRQNPADGNKLALLKSSLWSSGISVPHTRKEPKTAGGEGSDPAFRHAQTEATDSGF